MSKFWEIAKITYQSNIQAFVLQESVGIMMQLDALWRIMLQMAEKHSTLHKCAAGSTHQVHPWHTRCIVVSTRRVHLLHTLYTAVSTDQVHHLHASCAVA